MMRQLLLTVVALLGLLIPLSAADDTTVFLSKEEALQQVFAGADVVLELRQLLTPDEISRIEELLGSRLEEGGFFVYVGMNDGKPSSYAAVVSQIGKVKPITHIVEVLPNGSVDTVAVMIYRESHGDEVANDDFVGQYRGKTLEDQIRIDFDVVNIAGATLSGHALSRGVRKSLAVITALFLEASPDKHAQRLLLAEDITPDGLSGAPQIVAYEAGHLRRERKVMGTLCAVEAYAPAGMDDEQLGAAVEAALDEVARWDSILSDWDRETPLSALNAAPTGVEVELPDDLEAWLLDARRWTEATDGAFDPTLGALIDAWGLRSRTPSRPGRMALRSARESCGFGHLQFDETRHMASRQHPGLRLDPGASGKGWALDHAAKVLAERGVERALLSFRSSMKALGPPPNSEGWVIPVVHDAGGVEIARLELAHGALSVSGGGLRQFSDGDIQLGHVLDPRSGVPVPAERLAWVLHDSASASDALATALLVTGEDLPPLSDATGGYAPSADTPYEAWGRSP